MEARISKKQQFFNQIKLTKDDDLYIGIDVQKATSGPPVDLYGDCINKQY